jgi:hypothetical protein
MTYPSDSYMANLNFLVKLGVGSWFPIWAVRSRYKLDKPLDVDMKLVRWAVVLGGLALAAMPGRKLEVVFGLAGFAGWFFLLWPNLAFHVVSLLRRDTPESAA